MAGAHLLIGIGEGLIAATTVATVAKVRPDLVYALRRFRRPAAAAPRRPSEVPGMKQATRLVPRRRPAGRAAAGRRGEQLRLGSPDGLDSAARKGCTFDADGEITGGTCMAQQEQDHQLADSPLADYGIRGIDNAFLSTGLSGVLGVLVTFAIGGGLFWLVRRRGPRRSEPTPAQA